MILNDFLIQKITPSHKATGVEQDTVIAISFSKDMDTQSLNSGTIFLRKVNGDTVPVTTDYVHANKQYLMSPSEPLTDGTQYEVIIRGGADGIKSILEEHLSEDRRYTFTTDYSGTLSNPRNLSYEQNGPFVFVKWEKPSSALSTETISYRVSLSNSVIPPSENTSDIIWPSSGSYYTTIQTELDIPKRLSESNYYLHVQAFSDENESQWETKQFYMEAEKTDDTSTPSEPSEPSEPDEDASTFWVSETYPQNGSVQTSTSRVFLMFSSPLGEEIAPESVLVFKTPQEKLSFFHQAGLVEQNFVSTSLKKNEEYPNVLIIDIEEELESGQSYTVKVSGVTSEEGDQLEQAYTFSFATALSPLYGDPEKVKMFLGPMAQYLEDNVLISMMHSISVEAMDILSRQPGFTESDFEDGLAPFYVHRYVEAKVAYDMAIRYSLSESSRSGKTIRLSDLQVTNSEGSSSMEAMILRLKDNIRPWLDYLYGRVDRGYAKAVFVQRSEEGNPYPDHIERGELRELGGS